jgi:hypothetical protein
MDKKFIFILIAVVAFLASCGPKPNDKGEFVIKTSNDNKEIHIKLFGDGKIEYIREMKADQVDGVFMNFHNNGKPKDMGTMAGGKNEGAGIIFYPDGSVKSMGMYTNDQRNGNFWLFDKHRNLVEKREYAVVNDSGQPNQWIKFDYNMRPMMSESNFVSLIARNDTITSGEPYELDITLEASYYKEYMAVVIGPFDKDYKLPANSKCDTIVARNFSAIYKTSEYRTGTNTIRGIVQDIHVTPDKAGSKARSIYFSKEFLVRK